MAGLRSTDSRHELDLSQAQRRSVSGCAQPYQLYSEVRTLLSASSNPSFLKPTYAGMRPAPSPRPSMRRINSQMAVTARRIRNTETARPRRRRSFSRRAASPVLPGLVRDSHAGFDRLTDIPEIEAVHREACLDEIFAPVNQAELGLGDLHSVFVGSCQHGFGPLERRSPVR